jgi:hypothetical protein
MTTLVIVSEARQSTHNRHREQSVAIQFFAALQWIASLRSQ